MQHLWNLGLAMWSLDAWMVNGADPRAKSGLSVSGEQCFLRSPMLGCRAAVLFVLGLLGVPVLVLVLEPSEERRSPRPERAVLRRMALTPGVWRASRAVLRRTALTPGVWRASRAVLRRTALTPGVWRASRAVLRRMALTPGVWRASRAVLRRTALTPGVWRG